MKRKQDPINKVILKDGSIRYRTIVDVGRRADGGRDQRTITRKTYKEAKDERARIISERSNGTYVAPTKLNVSEYLNQWLDGKRNLRPGTRDRYRDALKPVHERLGKVTLQALRKTDVDKLVDWMLANGRRTKTSAAKGLSARSVNIMLTTLVSALDSALKQGIIPRNVAGLVERPSQRRHQMKTWTAGQAQVFLDYVAQERLFPMWLLTMYGLRRSEVLGLRWTDIDLNAKTMHIQWARTATAEEGIVEGEPKTERGTRVLPLDDELVAALRKLKAVQAREKLAAGAAYESCPLCDGAHVVVDELGRPKRPKWMSERFDVYARRAGLPDIRLHDTRHTCGTLMHLREVPIAVISAWLGHASAAFTMRTYVHSQNSELVAAGATLATALNLRPKLAQ